MHTIEDGLVRGALVEALKRCDGREVAVACATLLNRGKQSLIVDACFAVANMVHPRYTVALLQVFQKRVRSTEDLAQLVTTCVTGIRDAGGVQTPLVPRIARVITDVVLGAHSLDIDVLMLRQLPLKIGKKWAPMAALCLATVTDAIVQAHVLANPKLVRLFVGEATPVTSKDDPAKTDGDEEDRCDPIDIGVKLGAMWTFVREESGVGHRYVPPLIQDPVCEKVIRNLQTEQPEQKVTCLRS
jgi:hypothetical protein